MVMIYGCELCDCCSTSTDASNAKLEEPSVSPNTPKSVQCGRSNPTTLVILIPSLVLLELCVVQEELTLSKSAVLELKQRLGSKEYLITELSQELDVKKASEIAVKEDLSALKSLLAETKQDLEGKIYELADAKLKLEEEAGARGTVEAGLRTHEEKISTLQEDLINVLKEKEALEMAVADLTSQAANTSELCNDLEEKLKLSNDNFEKTDSLLSQALANNEELENKLKSLEELHTESRFVPNNYETTYDIQ